MRTLKSYGGFAKFWVLFLFLVGIPEKNEHCPFFEFQILQELLKIKDANGKNYYIFVHEMAKVVSAAPPILRRLSHSRFSYISVTQILTC